jgi:hypothetical protein
MAHTDNGKWKTWILAAAALVAPAVMSAHSQAAAAAQSDRGELDQVDAAPQGNCPFTCNSDSSCTIGCQTEAKCVSHRCIEL